MRMPRFIIILLVLMPLSLMAAQDFYSFSTPQQQQRFETLTNQLRCVVCQNQTIAESNAGIANDLREQIYQKIQAGQSDQAILAYLTDRYGSYILYQPPFNTNTLVLWLAPLLILIVGIGALMFYIRKERDKSC